MSGPTEHQTVQARILAYAEAIGWSLVSQKEAEQRRGFDASSPKSYAVTSPETPIKDRAKGRTLFFEDLLDANPSPPIGYAAARVWNLILKRKRRLRGFPDTAFRPRIPSPQRFIARPKPLSNLKFP